VDKGANLERTIRIGTRGSKLALWQAEWVKGEIEKRHRGKKVELEKIKTTGDKITDVPLAKVGGKGLFVKEIEEALLSERIDLAVHSMKDVPTVLPKELHLLAITQREDPRDTAILRNGTKLLDLPEGARIGTSSLRRQAQLLNKRPDFELINLRGNLDTRIRKLEEGQYDAVILAGAGITRLGWADKITEYISPDVMLPAIGQGALGIETRVKDDYINDLLSFFDHTETSVCVRAERAFLKRLEGGCQVPIAAYGTVDKEALNLTGLVASTEGRTVIKDSIEGRSDRAEELGTELAERLLDMGAREILEELYKVETPDERKNAPEV
jgi:hydroxymethylbilane synthase